MLAAAALVAVGCADAKEPAPLLRAKGIDVAFALEAGLSGMPVFQGPVVLAPSLRPCRVEPVVAVAKAAATIETEDETPVEKIVALGEGAVAPLVVLTKSSAARVAAPAAHALHFFPCREAVARVEVLLAHPAPSMRSGALLPLAGSQKDAATPRLIGLLDDQDEGVVHHAIDALRRVGDTRAIAPLEQLASRRPAVGDRAKAAAAEINARGR